MGKMILVTGGARSGKSTFAEETASGFGPDVLYVATSIPFDEEMKLRIQKHREQRPPNWETLEIYKDMDCGIGGAVDGKSAVLLDCITIMITNIMFECDTDWGNLDAERMLSLEAGVRKEIEKLIGIAKVSNIPFVIVTNEIGMGVVPDNALTRLFRDIAGRMNQILAREADEVYLCVSGIPVRIKG